MPKGIVIPADEDAPLRAEEFSEFADYQRAVGGLIQPVDVDDLKVTFYVNEEGKLHGLPANWRATLLWWVNEPSMRDRDYFVGDVVLVGAPDGSGDTTDLPEEMTDALLSERPWRVEVQLADEPGVWQRAQATYPTYLAACNAVLVVTSWWVAVTDTRIVPA